MRVPKVLQGLVESRVEVTGNLRASCGSDIDLTENLQLTTKDELTRRTRARTDLDAAGRVGRVACCLGSVAFLRDVGNSAAWMRPLWCVCSRVRRRDVAQRGATQECKLLAYMMCMTVWVACAHVCIWIQVSGVMASHDNDKPTPGLVESIEGDNSEEEDDLPDMVASSSSEGDSSEEDERRRLTVFARAPLARRRIAERSARPRVPAGRKRAVSVAGPLRRPAQGLFLAGTGRSLDGIAVLGAAFGSPEDDPNDNTGSPGHWERSMRPDDTSLDEIEEESPATAQVAGPDSNTLGTQDAGASGHKESSDGRSLS